MRLTLRMRNAAHVKKWLSQQISTVIPEYLNTLLHHNIFACTHLIFTVVNIYCMCNIIQYSCTVSCLIFVTVLCLPWYAVIGAFNSCCNVIYRATNRNGELRRLTPLHTMAWEVLRYVWMSLRNRHSFSPPAGWPYYLWHHKSLTHNLSQSLRLIMETSSAVWQ